MGDILSNRKHLKKQYIAASANPLPHISSNGQESTDASEIRRQVMEELEHSMDNRFRKIVDYLHTILAPLQPAQPPTEEETSPNGEVPVEIPEEIAPEPLPEDAQLPVVSPSEPEEFIPQGHLV